MTAVLFRRVFEDSTMSGTGLSPTKEWRPTIRALKLFVCLFGAVIVVFIAAAAFNTPDDPGNMAGAMSTVSPPGVLSPDEIPIGLEGHYQAAQTHFAIFEQIPCFCGCEEMLGHRHLGDGFVRADGSGLEAHALGCGVCLGEAEQVMQLILAGVTDADQIREAVVARWGDPYSAQ
jgi:hypothetical protein